MKPIGYLLVQADSPDRSFAYVDYDDTVYQSEDAALASVAASEIARRSLRVVAIVEVDR